jgi:CBS domain-containing protein
MQIKDLMSHSVEVVRPDTSIKEAAEKMSQLDIGPLPVCDGERLVGMVTDRDITVRAVAQGCDPNTTLARDVMTSEVVYCFEDQDVHTAARMMEHRQIRRLPVLNREKRLVGIVSLGDVALHSDNQALAGEALQDVSEPAAPLR